MLSSTKPPVPQDIESYRGTLKIFGLARMSKAESSSTTSPVISDTRLPVGRPFLMILPFPSSSVLISSIQPNSHAGLIFR